MTLVLIILLACSAVAILAVAEHAGPGAALKTIGVVFVIALIVWAITPARAQTVDYVYAAHLESVEDIYDGDTVELDVDLGFGVWLRDQKFRLYGIDAPEVRGPERPDGLRARDFLRNYLRGKTIIVRTHKDRKGKFGRWLATLFVGGKDINRLLVEVGHAEFATY